MTGLVPFSSNSSRNSALPYALSPSMHFGFFTLRISRSAAGQSCAWPPVTRIAIRRPLASASAWIFVLRPPRERPTACFCSPLFPRLPAMRFYMRRVDHLHVYGSSIPGKLAEKGFPDATPRPAHKAIIDCRRRTILGWPIAPAAAGFQDVHDTADNSTIINSLDTSYIRRQMRPHPPPLLIAQPKQVLAHDPDPPKAESDAYGIRIPLSQQQKIMSFDPNCYPSLRRSHSIFTIRDHEAETCA